ncbi:DEAD/DEAH box helicase family protein [Bacteroides fragilis]|uniref:Helicase ATP-binding domain-containing protein n=2 Tax=Bacteroides fragilis TaxID=817 RepID=A0A853PUD8_BACFG|nr:DEAD/DEAH box helicase family protein [Bacteroides fragilis str. 20793-3]MCS2357784.1 DEAD/DEAH box helicase family protein [Bacteroides fragilis]OCR32192.1 hypothetical protein AC094_18160 [Bacteroides fragilis]PJY65178.1 type III restriction enzyme, res subunit [Bacteroides fragilis]
MSKKNNEIQIFQKNLQNLLREEFGKRYIESVQMPEYFSTALNPAMKLRPYQEECFRYFLTYWENSFEGKSYLPQLLFHMATGSGKTLIMAGVMLYLYEKGYRNFLFFVNSTNIIEKTKENFLNPASAKYLFAPQITLNQKLVDIRLVDNFQSVDDDCINLCLTTTQGLHCSLNNPKENGITYDDFAGRKIVLISDEAHHINTATKKGKKVAEDASQDSLFEFNDEYSDDWETTVMRIFNSSNGASEPNVLLEFTATADLLDSNIAEKYHNKVIFDYPLKKFREDGYSKDIEVVQSDLSAIDRAVQAVILSQYKQKLFAAINQDIKPVMMLKSKTIKDNKLFYDNFISAIKRLNATDIAKLRELAKGDIKEAFSYFDELGIEVENFLLEIKEDFKEENLLLVDGNTITSEKQLLLNTLEVKDNEFRAVFAVDMLNEGWDVLNLFDIVRLYETRDSNKNKPGKTTMQEAQLIGRGARYMPFESPERDKPKGERKYDNDITNRLRAVEKLHYHSSHNPRYVAELQMAMEETGIVAKRSKEINLKLKDSFKKSLFYNDGYVFVNEKEPYIVNEELTSLGENILNQNFKVRIKSGEMRSSLVFEKVSNEDLTTLSTRTIRMYELGENVIRAAINRFDTYKFSELKGALPNLKSIKEFISSDHYLANLSITIYGKEEVLKNMSQVEKQSVAVEVLKQLEALLPKLSYAYRGTKRFIAKQVKDTFKDHVLKISLDGSEDKEFGKSMAESGSILFTTDLDKCDWYAYNDCYGTSEEKHLVKYIESVYDKLKEKYEDVYLMRNEKDVRIYSFVGGNTFEPDFLLFLKKKGKEGVYDNIQIFIEPKGGHLVKTDQWKEEFLLEIKDKADKLFITKTSKFSIWGLPFFTESRESVFDRALQKELGL